MSGNFLDRMKAKLEASGKTGRRDLEMHDARVVESGTAVRVLATYAEFYGPPSVHDINEWVKDRMGDFSTRVTPRLDTIQAYPERNFITFLLEQKRLRQPLSATELMVKAGPDTYLDNENQLWEVVQADEGQKYIVRRESTSIEEMLEVRKDTLRGGKSARKHMTFASVDSIPAAGGGFSSMDVGDVVDFYHNGQIHRGKVQSAGAAGVKVASLKTSDVYTVDPAAITAVIEKSAGADKQRDDIMRRYYSHVYTGNPEMTSIVSPGSNAPITDKRPPPGGEPVQPISVAASSRRVSGSARPFVQAKKAPYGWVVDYHTGKEIRPATKEEEKESINRAKHDGGTGVFKDKDGRSVYVEGSARPFGKASK
jgi:hypothetical protein